MNIKSLEQISQNEKQKYFELSNELNAAQARAIEAEAALASTRTELRRKNSCTDNDISTTEQIPSLHEDMVLPMEQLRREEQSEIIDLRTKNEQLNTQIKHLEKDVKDLQEQLEMLKSSQDTRIAVEKNHVEKKELECQRLEKLNADLQSARLRDEDKLKRLEVEKKNYLEKIQKLEKHIDTARIVISTYSSVSDGRESSAENLKLQNDIDKLQKDNENLRLKMDQYRCEACQEQRIITSNWYQEKMKNYVINHGLGSKIYNNSMTNSLSNIDSPSFSRSNQTTPTNLPKSFLTRHNSIKEVFNETVLSSIEVSSQVSLASMSEELVPVVVHTKGASTYADFTLFHMSSLKRVCQTVLGVSTFFCATTVTLLIFISPMFPLSWKVEYSAGAPPR